MGDDRSDAESRIEELRSRSPGEEESDPYGDVDVSTLPEWWQEAIREFESHGLRPYQPPRLEDGVLLHEVVEELEETHGVEIGFFCFNPEFGDDWYVSIDGEPIAEIGRRRSPEGYTVFESDRDAFVRLIEENVE